MSSAHSVHSWPYIIGMSIEMYVKFTYTCIIINTKYPNRYSKPSIKIYWSFSSIHLYLNNYYNDMLCVFVLIVLVYMCNMYMCTWFITNILQLIISNIILHILIDLFSINKSKLILILESIILDHNSYFLTFLCFEMKNRKSSLIWRRCSDQIKFTIVNGEQTPTNDQRNRFHSKHAKETRISRVECNRVTRRFARNLQRNWLAIFVASKATFQELELQCDAFVSRLHFNSKL